LYIPVEGRHLTFIVPEGSGKGTYSSSLYSMTSHHLFVGKPALPGGEGLLSLESGTNVLLEYQDAKDIPCRFETVVDELPDGGQHLLSLRCPDKIERHQRRENVRVPVAWPMTLTAGSRSLQASLNDVSGGGCSAWLSGRGELEVGDDVEIRFTVRTAKQSFHIESAATVIGIQPAEDGKPLLGSFKFTAMSDTQRQQIMAYVFERQLLDVSLRNAGRSIVF